jgi:hypothetical protein
MPYDPYDRECSGDDETTTEQVYLRHIRMELQNVTAAIVGLTDALNTQTRVLAAGSDARWAQLPATPAATYSAVGDEFDEPDIDDEPPPDYGPPGSGAVITEYD